MTNWYIVHCNPQNERKAVEEIRRAGFRAYMPRLTRVRKHHRTGDLLVKRSPLLVGYVFMRFPDGAPNWYALRQCQGVKGVLYVDGRPYELERSQVAVIMRAQRAMTHEDGETRSIRREMRRGKTKDVKTASRKVARERFYAGMHVTAPMTSVERVLARVIAVTKKGTVKAIVLSEGRELPVEFTDLESLVPIDQPREAA